MFIAPRAITLRSFGAPCVTVTSYKHTAPDGARFMATGYKHTAPDGARFMATGYKHIAPNGAKHTAPDGSAFHGYGRVSAMQPHVRCV